MWDAATLELAHALPQPAGARVESLAAVGGELWAGGGGAVVVWGVD